MAAERTYSAAVDNIFTTTWQSIKDGIVSQNFLMRPFLKKLVENGRITSQMSGGTAIRIDVEYAGQESNFKWIGRKEELGEAEDEFMTSFQFEWKYFAHSVERAFQDDHQNRGKGKIHDYVKRKVANMKNVVMDKIELSLFQNQGAKAWLSLDDLVSTTPTTGTIGAINRANSPWARNWAYDFSGDSLEANLLPQMDNMINNLTRYMSVSRPTPDIIITTQDVFERYHDRARAVHQIVANGEDSANLGFGNLTFRGIPMFWAPYCLSGRMYILNTMHLELIKDDFAWMNLGEWQKKINSEDRVANLVGTGAFTTNYPRKQGVIYGIPNA